MVRINKIVRLENVKPLDIFKTNGKTYIKGKENLGINLFSNTVIVRKIDSAYGIDVETGEIIGFNKYDTVEISSLFGEKG